MTYQSEPYPRQPLDDPLQRRRERFNRLRETIMKIHNNFVVIEKFEKKCGVDVDETIREDLLKMYDQIPKV